MIGSAPASISGSLILLALISGQKKQKFDTKNDLNETGRRYEYGVLLS